VRKRTIKAQSTLKWAWPSDRHQKLERSPVVFQWYDILQETKLGHSEKINGQAWWLTPVVLATQEAEIGRILVRSQNVREIPISINKPGVVVPN
jgi:hypothetical protein